MYRALICVFAAMFFVCSFTACISEKDKEDMRQMLKESESKASSGSANSTSSKAESSASDSEQMDEESASGNADKTESGATEIDNKQQPQQGNKDGITIHIPQSDIDKFNSEMLEIAKEFSKVAEEFSNDMENLPEISFESRDDLEYSTPDDWREYAESRRDATASWQNEE